MGCQKLDTDFSHVLEIIHSEKRHYAEKKCVNYYPFGLQHKGYNFVINGQHYPYGYNGKEENDKLGLEWLDFGARNYDASLGRWMNLDPLAENYYSYSPYNYVLNNPIIFVDPDGKRVSYGEFIDNAGREMGDVNRDDLSEVSADNGGGCPENDPDCNNSKNKDENKRLPLDEIGFGTDFIDKIVFPSLEDGTIITTIPVYNEAGQKIGEWTARSKVAFKALVKVGNVLRPVLRSVSPIATGISFTENTIDVINGDMSVFRYVYNTSGTGLSVYTSIAYGGPAGVAVGGLIYFGDLVIEAAEESQKQMKVANKNNPTEIHNTNVFSSGFWAEMNNFMTFDSFRWGFSR